MNETGFDDILSKVLLPTRNDDQIASTVVNGIIEFTKLVNRKICRKKLFIGLVVLIGYSSKLQYQ